MSSYGSYHIYGLCVALELDATAVDDSYSHGRGPVLGLSPVQSLQAFRTEMWT